MNPGRTKKTRGDLRLPPTRSPLGSWGQILITLLAVSAGCALPAGGATCAPSADGLIGWWPGDGNGNDIVGANHGSLQGGASASALGVVGSTFSFDGTNAYVQIPDAPELKPANLTLEAWVRFSSLDSQGSGGSPAGDQYIVFKQNSRTSGFEGFDLSKTRVGATDVFRFLITSATGLEAEIHSLSTVSTGVWYHVAGVRGSNFLQLYVNGQLERQTNVSFAQDYGSLPLFLGSSGQSFWDHKLKGSLDEVSLYNRALGSNEIGVVYGAGAGGKCKEVNITAQPQGQTVIAGNSALFSVVASGLAPLRYQWQFNGGNLSGATNSGLTLNNVQGTNGGSYTVVVSNKLSSATSAVAVLTVLVPPTITGQPQSRTNVAGSLASFGVSASGTTPLSYQWQFNGANLGTATGTNLNLSNVQPPDAGNYTVVVSNSAGTVTSAVATLTVVVPPAITVQPQSRTNIAGTVASFSAAATGSAPLNYQWQLNGGDIPGATGTNLTLNSAQATDAGNYTVIVTNTAGAATSAVATLTVRVPPAITDQPQSRTNIAGTTASFAVSASGTAPLNYQWQFSGIDIPGANGTQLNISNVQPADAGNYTIVVTNAAGAITSVVAALTVLVPPTIVTDPQSLTNIVGAAVTFGATASGTLPLAYQWRFNGANIAGATSTNLVLNNVQATDAGNYTLVVTNAAGTATSGVAVLTVLTPPIITVQPQSRTNIAGTTAAFSATATGTAPLSFQWQFNGVNIGAATGTNLTLSNIQASQSGNYTVVITNTAGAATSVVAVLTVLAPPTFTAQPQSRTNVMATLATFSAIVTGTAPLSYQWQFNATNLADGAPFSGVTTPTLTVNSVQPNHAGGYSILASNIAGSVTSVIATLTVNLPGCVPAYPGLIGWWPGDGNGNDIVGANHGSLQGGASASALGVVGSTFSFDGTNAYVQIPDAPELKPANLTLEAWVRFSSLDSQGSGGSPAGDQYIVFKQNSRTSGFEGFDLSKTRVGATDVFRFLITSATGLEAEIHSLSTVSTGVWYHVAGVRGSNFLQLYVNGQLERQTNVSFAQDYGSLPLFLGSSGQSFWDHKLKGSLDEVSLYNRALGSNEIGVVYGAGAGGKCKEVNITAQPQGQTVIAGNSALFSVVASGLAPLRYQWQFNGGNLSGATNSGLTLNNVQGTNGGSYTVVVSNKLSSATSAVAVLTVLVPPTITGQPQSRTNVAGSLASFGVSASGTTPLSYQWQFNGVSLAGATDPNLKLSNVQPVDAGNYTVIVTNTAGAITSAVATLTVLIPPTFTVQPQSRTNIARTFANFSAAATGTLPLSYQWQFNATDIAGANGTNLTLSNIQASDDGNYGVVVTNTAGSMTSAVAVLTVLVPPTITSAPQTRTNIAGSTVTFSASAGGTEPLFYQWQFNDANIGGATGTSLPLSNIQPADAGHYAIVVTNAAGAITSLVATLTVVVAPLIITQPQNLTNIVGTAATFSAAAIGTAPLDYQWCFNGENIAGRTSTNLTLDNVQPADAGNYTIVATNPVGAVTSTIATLTVLVAPMITVQPASQSVPAGTNVSFSVSAAGALPLGYQWRFNGTNLADGGPFNGVTSSTFSISYTLPLNAGTYSVVVTNIAGSVTSSVAGLTITSPDCVPAPAGVAGWWPADGNAKDIGGTNNGILQGSASASAVGFVGSAFSFDGTNGYIQIPDSPGLEPTNLTIEAWLRFNSLDSFRSASSPAGQQYIIFKQNTRSNNFEGYALTKTRIGGGDVLSFVVSSAAGQAAIVQSLTRVSTGMWYHVAVARGSNSLQLYVNGQLEGQTNVSFSQDYGNLPLYFGTSGQSFNDARFAGVLDEVTLYNRALSQSEIAAVYRAANVGLCRTPMFVTQPLGGTAYRGSSFTFTAAAAGALPMGYQWQKDSVLVANATNTSLPMANLQFTNAGNYVVAASNAYGSATSSLALLNVKLADVSLAFASGGGAQGAPGLTITGVAGQIYGIQFSPALGPSATWTGLANLTLTGPTLTWFDPQAPTVPQRYYRVVPGPIPIGTSGWEVADIGPLWTDDFNRAALGTNWTILGAANATIFGNELLLDQSNLNLSRQVYYQPWLTCSDEWTIRWSQRFGALNTSSRGIGVGIKNFQAAGGNDRGYNGLISGAGADLGRMEIQRFDGNQHVPAASGPAISLAAGNVLDCSLTRSGWTMIATASNRANAQVSSASFIFSDAANLIAPTISRICIYPIQGTVYLDDISFTINRRHPARFIVLGASLSEGYDASSYSNGFVRVVQRSFSQAVCNDSSSYNTTTNTVSVLPEILAHQPSTAILSIGGNDLLFGYPATQWQSQYSNLVAQLQLAGVQVKHCLPPPRNTVDLTSLKNWISTNYPAKDVIDIWTPLLQGSHSLNPAYDIGDGTHLNDAGHALLGQIITANLP